MDVIQALRAGDLALVLAAIKADPNSAESPRPIVEAARLAFLPAIQLLHKNKADLNASWRNYRPLHALIQRDPHELTGEPDPVRFDCLDWLLEHGANPEQLGAWPLARALLVAAFVGQPEYVKRLTSAGASMDGFTGAALGDLAMVKRAFKKSPEFARERDQGGLTALQCAAGSRLPDVKVLPIARLLLDSGAEINAVTHTWGEDVDAAYFAAGAANSAVFELLLDRGAYPTPAFSHAVWGKHFDMAEMALAHGAEPDRAMANGKPLLNDLVRWGQIPQANWLLAHGASPNVPDEVGWTALHQAVSRGNEGLLRALLDHGGDRAARDQSGQTALQMAKLARKPKLIALLST